MLRQEIEQAIEEITGFPAYQAYHKGGINKRLTDRICEAIGKTAEGKEPIKKDFEYTDSYQDGFIAGRRFERGEDQAHWQKELGK